MAEPLGEDESNAFVTTSQREILPARDDSIDDTADVSSFLQEADTAVDPASVELSINNREFNVDENTTQTDEKKDENGDNILEKTKEEIFETGVSREGKNSDESQASNNMKGGSGRNIQKQAKRTSIDNFNLDDADSDKHLGGGARPKHSKRVSIDNSYLHPESERQLHVSESSFPKLGDDDFRPFSKSANFVREIDETDENSGLPADILGALGSPCLEDNTPAAAALRSSAAVHVSRVDKFARRMKAQNIRRFVKTVVPKAPGRNKKKRGKPPRVPPSHGVEGSPGGSPINASMPEMFRIEEDMMDSSIDSDDNEHDDEGSIESDPGAATAALVSHSAPPDLAVKTHSPMPSKAIVQIEASPTPELPITEKRLSETVRHKNHHDLDLDDSDHILVGGDPDGITRKKTMNDDGRRAHFVDSGIPSEVHTDGKPKIPKHHNRLSWKKRRKKKRKEGRTYVKGKVIDGEHELYTLSIGMMLGLRTSIARTNTQLNDENERKWLEPEDFEHVEKYIFRPKGGPKTPPHQLGHTFKFKDYSPKTFAYLRRMFGVNEFDFLLSVCGNAHFIEFVSNAKSGQFFFYSGDGKHMIKTMTNAESKFLRRILPHYFRHCVQNPNTLITQFLGMYRVKLYHLRRNVKFIIMNSVFDTDKVIHGYYDLKGSTIGRDAKPHHDVKKDNDFRRRKPESVMQLHPDVHARMRKQLVADMEFFKKMKIMDYSMLIGIAAVLPKQGSGITNGKRGSYITVNSSDTSDRKDKPTQTGSISKGSLNRNSKIDSSTSSQNKAAGSSIVNQEKEVSRLSRDSAAVAQSITSDGGYAGDGTSASASIRTLDYVYEDDDDSFLDTQHQALSYHGARLSSIPTDPNAYHVSRDTSDSVKDIFQTIHHHTPLSNLPLPAFARDGHNAESVSTDVDDPEVKKQFTAIQMFWPFHRFYDIHGHRRMYPPLCPYCEKDSCDCIENKEAIEKWDMPPFEQPLSNRKDGGYMMDTTGFELPMKMNANGKIILCENKIFYMGIIDILQQFNARKRVEAQWRRVEGGSWKGASCVHPNLYADRFLEFFDEYTQLPPTENGEKGHAGKRKESEPPIQQKEVDTNDNKIADNKGGMQVPNNTEVKSEGSG